MNLPETKEQVIAPEVVDTQKLKSKLGILSRTSPWIIIPLDVAAATGLAVFGYFQRDLNPLNYFWVFLLGIFAWTLIEYVMHRFAFHYPATSEKGKKAIWLVHGVHHDDPKHPDKLYQPPLTNIILMFLFYVSISLMMGKFVYLFLPGIIIGYLMYSSIHFIIHNFKPPFKWLQPLWRHHNMHHYRFTNKAFGVSTPFWDMIFGTLPPKNITDGSENQPK
jgi:sterol desaturase/sphingolipid hydroxylase (fatty acid hydroxylase superfamily)